MDKMKTEVDDFCSGKTSIEDDQNVATTYDDS